MTNEDLQAKLDTMAVAAPKLRAAGISGRVKVGDIEFDVEPAAPAFGDDDDADDQSTNPLDDPATFNRQSGAPSRRRRLIDGESDHGDRG